MEKQYDRESLLISAPELQAKLGSPDLCIIDVRPAEDFADRILEAASPPNASSKAAA